MPKYPRDEIQDFEVMASAARTATTASGDFTNTHYRGLIVFVNISAINLTPSVTFTIEGKDHVGNYFTILASAAKTGTGAFQMFVHPDITAAANVSAAAMVPRTFRVNVTHGDTDSMTYSIQAQLVP